MKPLLIFIVTSGAVSPPAPAQVSEIPYTQQVDWFFNSLRTGRTDDAVDAIYANNERIKANPDEIVKLKAAIRGWPALLGDFLGTERLTEEHVGARWVHLDFIAYFDRGPLRIYFQFYRSRNGWVAQTVGLMDDISDWSRERAKARYLNSTQR